MLIFTDRPPPKKVCGLYIRENVDIEGRPLMYITEMYLVPIYFENPARKSHQVLEVTLDSMNLVYKIALSLVSWALKWNLGHKK